MAIVELLFIIYTCVCSTGYAESEVCSNRIDPTCKNPLANDNAARLTDAQVESMDDGVAAKMKLQLLQTSSAQEINSDLFTEEGASQDRPSSMDEATQAEKRREELGRLNQERRLEQTKKRQELAAERMAAELAKNQQSGQPSQGLVMTPYGMMPAQTFSAPMASDGSMQAQQVPQMPVQQIPVQHVHSQMMPSQQTLQSNQAMQYQPVQVGNQIQYIPVMPQTGYGASATQMVPMMAASGLSGSEPASLSSTAERRTVKGRRFSAQDAIKNQESERNRAAERRSRQKMKQRKGLALSEESVVTGKPVTQDLLDTEPTTPVSKHPDVVGLSGDKAEKRQAMIDKLRTQTDDEVGYATEAAHARRDQMQKLLEQQDRARMAAKQYRMQSVMSRAAASQVGGMPSASVGMGYSAPSMATANTVASKPMSMGYSMNPMNAGTSVQALNARPVTPARVHAPDAAEIAANERRAQRQEMIRQHWAERTQFGGHQAQAQRQQMQMMPQMMPRSSSMPQYMPSSAVSPYAMSLDLESKDPRTKPAVEKKENNAPEEIEEHLKKSLPHDLLLERQSLQEEDLHKTNMKRIEEKKDQTMKQIYKNIDKENQRHDAITGTIKHVENQLSDNDAKSANEDASEHLRHQKQMHHFEEAIESAQAEHDEKVHDEILRHSRESQTVSRELGH